MSRLPEGSSDASVNGRQCDIVPRRIAVAINYNISSPCRSSQPLNLLGYASTPLVSAALKTQAASSDLASRSSVVVAKKATSSAESTISSITSSTPTSSISLQAISSTSSTTSTSASTSLPSTTVTVQSTTTATPVSTSSIVVNSTSTSTSPSTSTSTRQTTIIQDNTPIINSLQFPQPTTTTTQSNAPPINVPNTSSPGSNNSPHRNPPPAQKASVDGSPTIRPPAEQVGSPTQQARASSSATQRSPSNRVSTPDEAAASNSRGSTTPSSSGSDSTPSSITPEKAGSSSSGIGVVAPALPTTLETSSQNLLFTSRGREEQQTTATELPTATSSDPFLEGSPPDITPVGDLRRPPGHTKPSVGAATSRHATGSQISTGAIVGISIGSIVGLAVIGFLIWLTKRRSKKGANSTGSPVGDDNKGSSRRGRTPFAIFRNQTGKWLPGAGKAEAISNSKTSDRSIRPSLPATNMAEWRVQSGSQPTHLYNGPSQQQFPFQTTSTRNMFGDPSVDEESQRGLIFGQSQATLSDPFSDANAAVFPLPIPSLPPTALLYSSPSSGQDKPLRSSPSRGRSLSADEPTSQHLPPNATAARPRSVHRESIPSTDSFANKRKKFRSDPFDLEIKSRLISGEVTVPEMPHRTATSSTYSVDPMSNSSSRYTSGVSVLSDWSLLQEGRPSAPYSVATGAPPKQSASWDSPSSSNALRPGDPKWLPRRAAEQPQVVFGQAL